MHHAVRALRITRFGAIVLPLRCFDEFLKRVRVAVLQEVARFLPAENVVCRHTPRSAGILLPAHQKFEEQWRLVEAPTLLAVGKDSAEKAPGARAAEKMLLVRSFIVGIAGRKHHALDAQLHHFVEECAHALRVGAVKERRVRGHAKAALQRFPNSFDGQVVAALAAHGKIVMLALAVDVNGESQVLARLEEMNLLLEQQRIRAQINVLLAGDQALDDFVDLRMHQRFAAGNGNHRRAALLDRFEAILGAQVLFQDVRRILNLAATRAR